MWRVPSIVASAWLALVACSSSSSDGTAAQTGAGGGAGTAGSAGSSGGGASGSASGSSGSSGASGSASGSSGASGGGQSGGASGGSAGTAGSSGANSCTQANADCVGNNSGCNIGSYYLYDNQWNCGGSPCGPESAYGCLESDGSVSFVVSSNQPKGNTAVLTYPAIQSNFDKKPLLSSFSSISATFAETSPGKLGDYEVAWDCWFNDNANELMIWVDTYKQVPGGNKVASAVMLGGRSYDIWWGPGTGTGGYVVFYANAPLTSGTVDLLEIFDYATSHGWLPATSTVNQLSFGIEVCSTDDQDASWTIENYALSAK